MRARASCTRPSPSALRTHGALCSKYSVRRNSNSVESNSPSNVGSTSHAPVDEPFERPLQMLFPQPLSKGTKKLRNQILDRGEPVPPSRGVLDSPKPITALIGKIDHDTYKAIAVGPFKLRHTTVVQDAVFSHIAKVAQPHNTAELAERSSRPDMLLVSSPSSGTTLSLLVLAIEARLNSIKAHIEQAIADTGKAFDKDMKDRVKMVFTRINTGTLILAPTRESATQTANDALRLSHHHEGFEVRLFIAGISKHSSVKEWMKGRRDIVVATPGRLRDLLIHYPEIQEGLSRCQQVIIEDADTMLDMGYRTDIDEILKILPPSPQRQTFISTARLNAPVRQITQSLLRDNHVTVNLEAKPTTVHNNVPQYQCVLPGPEYQISHIVRLLGLDQMVNQEKSKIVIYVQTPRMAMLFSKILSEVAQLALPSPQTTIFEVHPLQTPLESRMHLSRFLNETSPSICVTSDFKFRDTDSRVVTHVIQIGVPPSSDHYVARVGITASTDGPKRSDLVLLPWEIGLLTWKLEDAPLKPLTVAELRRQVMELAEQTDADLPTTRRHLTLSPSNPSVMLTKDPLAHDLVAYRMEAQCLGSNVTGTLSKLDPELVREAFASLLGYYIPKAADLRINKDVTIEGLRIWSVKAMGKVAQVSEGFLERLGRSDGRSKRFALTPVDDEARKEFLGLAERDRIKELRWTGRGRTASQDGSVKPRKLQPEWVTARHAPLAPDDPNPVEYVTNRFGKSPRVPRQQAPHLAQQDPLLSRAESTERSTPSAKTDHPSTHRDNQPFGKSHRQTDRGKPKERVSWSRKADST